MKIMKKEKLAIVSSHSDFCGNASYTKALGDGLAKYYDLTVVSLNVEILRKGSSRRVRQYIDLLCAELQSFDCVNIQFEAGLFGLSLSGIRKNLFQVARASKKVVLTMHRIDGELRYPSVSHAGKILLSSGLKRLFRSYIEVYANNRCVSLYSKVVRFCMKYKMPIIVHTQRDRKYIKQRFGFDLVFDHPLCFYNQSYIQSLAKSYSRDDFHQDFFLDSDSIYIGIFGFISRYKGHKTAIKALKLLPPKYKLLIFGAQHPHTIAVGESINPDLRVLLDLVDDLDLSNRVAFHRIGSDTEFLKSLLNCDFNVLPYLEVNQGGSGIAALSLETNSNAIFSQNRAFFELEKYAPEVFKMFSIGNYNELANAILSYHKEKFSPHLEKYHNTYNLSTNVELYRRLLSRNFSSSLSQNLSMLGSRKDCRV